MKFASLGTNYIEMLESDLGKEAMGAGGSGLVKFIANLKLASHQTEINKELIHQQYEIIERENPDRILYTGKVTYPIIWGLDHSRKNILVCPLPYMHYVRNHSHVAFNGNFGSFLNKLTYSLADFGLILTVRISANWLKLKKKVTLNQLKNTLLTTKVIYSISPSLFSRPDYWNERLKVLGFHERKQTLNWQPDQSLTDFLENHKYNRVLLITFGSMVNPEPVEKTKMIVEILERNRIPAIMNTYSGGMIRPDQYDSDLLYFIPRIPYDWIFPKIYGIIHHGGSGTTHMALKYGCATLIIPHIIDQFVWDKIISDMGCGPKGIKINNLTGKNLEPKILELVNNSSYKKNAEQVAGQIRTESLEEELYQFIIQE